MKKKIAILGSTGSIGKTLIEIIKKDKKNFDVILLTADKNYKEILKQAKILKVKNLIITDKKAYLNLSQNKFRHIKIFNNYDCFNNILLCFLVSLISQLGDLFISFLKRKAKIKDTGKLLPGHGGVLDRVDGIIFAIPFTYFLLKLF